MAKDLYAEIDADANLIRQSIEDAITRVSNAAGTGRYQVQFAPQFFETEPYALATVMTDNDACGSNGTNRTISVTNITVNEVCVAIRQASEGNTRSNKRFILHVFEP